MSVFDVNFASLSLTENAQTDGSGTSPIVENAFSDTLAIDHMTTMETEASYDYMSECYEFLMGYNRSYHDASKKLYKTILESHNVPEVINEGFGDFFSKIKEIIKKFLAWIKKIFNKFIAKLNGMFKSESYLKKNKNEFSKFTTNDEFEFEGYKFTHLGAADDVPKISTIKMTDIDDSMKSAFSVNVSQQLDYDNLKSKYDQFEDNKEDFYDKFRGEVLGEGSDIPSTQFEEECFMKFRDDAKDKSKFTVTSSVVSESYMNFENYDKLKRAIEKTKNEIDKEYTALERYFEKSYKMSKDSFSITDYSGSHSTYVGGTRTDLGMDRVPDDMDYANVTSSKNANLSSSEKKSLIESYLRARAAQVNQMSNIHGIAFSAKLTAAKDCFNQDKAILYKALSKIKGHKIENV